MTPVNKGWISNNVIWRKVVVKVKDLAVDPRMYLVIHWALPEKL